MKKTITIDSSKGGNGDVWMRLVSFYSVAAQLPQLRLYICVPPFLLELAKVTFGDRLNIIERTDNKVDLRYTSLGIKDLIKSILNGNKYISPYQRVVINDKKKKRLKDYLNIVIFNIADYIGVVQVPAWKWITVYQGYSDIIGIKNLRMLSYENYLLQLKKDSEIIFEKLQNNIPTSLRLTVPSDLDKNILIFPNGTGRQFIPVWFASKYLPDAYYAFFYKDTHANDFIDAHLKVIHFFEQPGDIIKLSHDAKWTVTTDSFPSHLLQSSTVKCTVLLTELLKTRIVSPAFLGIVVESEAPCYPCLHLDRGNHPLCAAGYRECLNWSNTKYIGNVLSSLPA